MRLSFSRRGSCNTRRRQVLAGVLLSASVGLAACGHEETGALLDSTWQITHI